jgi:hypothetical protein
MRRRYLAQPGSVLLLEHLALGLAVVLRALAAFGLGGGALADIVAGLALVGALGGGAGAFEDGAAGGGLGVSDIDERDDRRERAGEEAKAQTNTGAATSSGEITLRPGRAK